MIVVGLTGSIGMGKTTVARMFAEEGVPVWSADEAVHRLYAPGAPGAAVVARLVPEAVGSRGVDRARLRAAALADPTFLERIEAAIHPLVAEDRARFLAEARKSGAPVAVCEVPLLFETGAEKKCDRVVVVSAPPEVQRARVLGREGMSPELLDRLLARQLPDAEKRRRADFVIDTGCSKEATRAQVRKVLDRLRAQAREGDCRHA